MKPKQRIAFLYLHTGGGHVSGAKALSGRISELHPDTVECVLKDGFEKNVPLTKMFLEKGYSVSSNYFEAGYVAFYQLTKHVEVLKFSEKILKPFVVPALADFFEKERISKVVCLHQALVVLARSAIDRMHASIPLVTLVMDPFTAHPLWFYEKNTELIVFSKKIENEAVSAFGFDKTRVHHFPLMLSRKFDIPYTTEEKKAAKERHGVPLNKPVILIAGGGEGLKKALPIVKAFIKENIDAHVIVVCGKNKVLKFQLELLVSSHTCRNISIYGFVDCMPDFMNIADCVITKGGPATVMETLSIEKPLILATYVRGQELGNMQYVVRNNVGWYLPRPHQIVEKTKELIADKNLRERIAERIRSLGIRNGVTDIAEFVYHFGE